MPILIGALILAGVFYGGIYYAFAQRCKKLDEDWDALKRSDLNRLRDKR